MLCFTLLLCLRVSGQEKSWMTKTFDVRVCSHEFDLSASWMSSLTPYWISRAYHFCLSLRFLIRVTAWTPYSLFWIPISRRPTANGSHMPSGVLGLLILTWRGGSSSRPRQFLHYSLQAYKLQYPFLCLCALLFQMQESTRPEAQTDPWFSFLSHTPSYLIRWVKGWFFCFSVLCVFSVSRLHIKGCSLPSLNAEHPYSCRTLPVISSASTWQPGHWLQEDRIRHEACEAKET